MPQAVLLPLCRVPWRTGLNLYSSSVMGKIRLAEQALSMVRGGRLVYQTARAVNATAAIKVQPGDVIQLARFLATIG